MVEEQLRRAGPEELGCDDRRRFELELEFLHCLSNPGYLNWLSQNRYLDDPAFLQYLQYLQYWQQPQYAKFVVYPHALYFLDLLQTPEFRAKIANPAYKELVHTQQYYYWQHARANRVREKMDMEKEGEERRQQQQAAAAGGAAAGASAQQQQQRQQGGPAAMQVDGGPGAAHAPPQQQPALPG